MNADRTRDAAPRPQVAPARIDAGPEPAETPAEALPADATACARECRLIEHVELLTNSVIDIAQLRPLLSDMASKKKRELGEPAEQRPVSRRSSFST